MHWNYESNDNYAMYCTFLELFSWAELPWDGVADDDVIPRLLSREKLACPAQCPDEIYSIMFECWKLDTQRRPGADQIASRVQAFVTSNYADISSLDWPEASQLTRKNRKQAFYKHSHIDVDSKDNMAAFERLEVEGSAIVMDKELGRGQFGSVHLGSLKGEVGQEQTVAVKMLHSSSVPEIERLQFTYEARLLCALAHPNIVSVCAVKFAAAPYMLALEFMGNGDLRAYLKAHQLQLSDDVSLLIGSCAQIASAMAYLESNHVIHRDLAAR